MSDGTSRRWTAPVLVAAFILAAGAFRQELRHSAGLAASAWSREFERAQNPGMPDAELPSGIAARRVAAGSTPPPSNPLPPTAAPVIPKDALAYRAPPVPPPPPSTPPKPYEPRVKLPEVQRVATRPAEPPPPDGATRGAVRVYGVVYGLTGLEPAATATVTFLGSAGPYKVVTDDAGHYQVDLPAKLVEEGLAVSVTAEGYRAGQLEDGDPPYLDRTDEQRRAVLDELGPTDLDPPRFRGRANAPVASYDLVLLRPDEPGQKKKKKRAR